MMSKDHTPHTDELEEILDSHAEYYIRQTVKFFNGEGESPDLSKNNEGDLAAKAKLDAYVTARVTDELKRLPKNKLRDHINEAGQRKDIAIVNYRFVEERLAELKQGVLL